MDAAVDLQLPDIDSFDFDLDLSLDEIEMPDVSGSLVDNRYMPPKVMKATNRMVAVNNAAEAVRRMRVGRGERSTAIVGGNFVWGDFVTSYIRQEGKRCEELIITTLSYTDDNLRQLGDLFARGLVGKLYLITSDYFYYHEQHRLIPLAYDVLDDGTDRFQLAIVRTHTKTAQWKCEGDDGETWYVTVSGSANMRSALTMETFQVEEGRELYDFYAEPFKALCEKYGTIDRTVSKTEGFQTVKTICDEKRQ